jgi:ribosome biogenesis GTPase A
VLLNDIPGDSIVHKRGLQQGDPLSPMLFILIMDVPGLMFSRAEQAGLLLDLSPRAHLHHVSMYADDVALFLHPSAAHISILLLLLIV